MGIIILGIAFIAFGILLVVIFLKILKWRFNLLKIGERTDATIVRVDAQAAYRSINYHPVFQYKAYGKIVTTRYRYPSTRRKKYAKQNILKIAYNRENPSDIVIINDKLQSICAVLCMVLLGLPLIAAGFFSIYFSV